MKVYWSAAGGISSQPFGRVILDQGQEPQRGDSIHSESGYLLGVLAHGFCVQEGGQDRPSSWVLCPLSICGLASLVDPIK